MHSSLPSIILTSLLLPALPLASTTSSNPPAPPPLYTATIHHLPTLPSFSSPPTPLATLHYHPSHPHLSRLHTFTPPPNITSDSTSLTRIGIYFPNNNTDPSNPHLRSSATATYSFHAPYKGRLRVWVRPDDGEVVGVSWRAWRDRGEEVGKGKRKERWDGKGDFDIVTVKPAPVVVFDMPVKGKGGSAAQGQGQPAGQGVEGEEEVVEKTFLQKYWWLLLGAAVLAMTGGGGEK